MPLPRVVYPLSEKECVRLILRESTIFSRMTKDGRTSSPEDDSFFLKRLKEILAKEVR